MFNFDISNKQLFAQNSVLANEIMTIFWLMTYNILTKLWLYYRRQEACKLQPIIATVPLTEKPGSWFAIAKDAKGNVKERHCK